MYMYHFSEKLSVKTYETIIPRGATNESKRTAHRFSNIGSIASIFMFLKRCLWWSLFLVEMPLMIRMKMKSFSMIIYVMMNLRRYIKT